MQLHQLSSLHQTTDEWMINLQSYLVDNGVKKLLFSIPLRQVDAVKFAKYLPPSSQERTTAVCYKTNVEKKFLYYPAVYSNYQPKQF